jgi:hypothetical protein
MTDKPPKFITAIAHTFGRRKRCSLEVYGKPQKEYQQGQVLWIQHPEDEYAIPSMKEPFCVLRRIAWVNGEELF